MASGEPGHGASPSEDHAAGGEWMGSHQALPATDAPGPYAPRGGATGGQCNGSAVRPNDRRRFSD